MLKHISFLLAGVIALAFSAVNPQNVEAEIFRNISDLNDSVGFAQDPVFNGVGLLTGDDANGGSFIAGTGVFIGNGLDGQNAWVLTAGHSLFDEPNLLWDSMQFNPSADVGSNLTNFFDVEEVFPFPDYVGDVGGGIGNDIGLVKLSNPINNIAAAQLFQGLDNDLIGAEFITAGYGNPGLFGQPLGNFDGIRRGGRNIIESAGGTFTGGTIEEQFFVSDFDRFNSDNPLALEWQASPNDSGSPWFVDVNGEYQIAGIVNGALNNNLSSFSIRTSLYNDFIDDTIRANSVPEPGTMTLLTLGMFGAAARRRVK